MKKRVLAAFLTTAIVMAMTGCGGSTASATTQAASAEVAAEDEWENDPTAYLSGIKASDYVELPADYSALTVEVEPAAEVADEEVENMINSYRESRKELQEITNRSVVQEGDVVNIDYVGRINGEEFDASRKATLSISTMSDASTARSLTAEARKDIILKSVPAALSKDLRAA